MEGPPCFCEFYLQELYQILMVNIGGKNPPSTPMILAGEGKSNHVETCQSFASSHQQYVCNCSTYQPVLVSRVFFRGILLGVHSYGIVIFICISLVTNNIEHLLICLFATHTFSCSSCSSDFLLIF